MRIAALVLLGAILGGCDRSPAISARYYYGGEVNVVCPCSGGKCYWVRAEPAIGNRLKDFVMRQTGQPYQAVYLRFHGHLLYEPGVGFAANYDGLMSVTEVLTLTTEIPASCPDP